MFKWN